MRKGVGRLPVKWLANCIVAGIIWMCSCGRILNMGPICLFKKWKKIFTVYWEEIKNKTSGKLIVVPFCPGILSSDFVFLFLNGNKSPGLSGNKVVDGGDVTDGRREV